MQVNDCIKGMARAAGVSLAEVSRRLGRSERWASVVGAPGRSPALATVADVADACGFALAVVDRETGETVGTIEPPRAASKDGDQEEG